jgi:hypothetical protein
MAQRYGKKIRIAKKLAENLLFSKLLPKFAPDK